jgi:hypothetical protein
MFVWAVILLVTVTTPLRGQHGETENGTVAARWSTDNWILVKLQSPAFGACGVTVGTVVELVAAGRTRDEILLENPYLEAEDIAEALFRADCPVDPQRARPTANENELCGARASKSPSKAIKV